MAAQIYILIRENWEDRTHAPDKVVWYHLIRCSPLLHHDGFTKKNNLCIILGAVDDYVERMEGQYVFNSVLADPQCA